MKMSDSVLIIGGGFSGTMVAVQLAERQVPSIVIDPANRPGRGLAYSTVSPDHLLNVRAANMSAYPDKPDDFVLHIAQRDGRPDTFASRIEYGDYIDSTLAKAVAEGYVTLVCGRAVHAQPRANQWLVRLDTGQLISGTNLVLATGNAAPGALDGLENIRAPDIIDLLWAPDGYARMERAAAIDEPVLIVGTGLSMVDAMLSLSSAGHSGKVTALSRRGLLPMPHSDEPGSTLSAPALGDLPKPLSGQLRWLRTRAKTETDWRHAVDALRPLTQQLWQRMDRSTQERFLRHARPWWDVHRHRIAPQIHAQLAGLISQGRLRVLAGRLLDSRRNADHYSIGIARRGSGARIEVDAGLVINCTGPLSGLRDNPDRLITQMLEDDLLRADGLDLGAEVDSSDRLIGLPNAYAIGPIVRGQYWEITAVPDLRIKAAEIATAIATAVREDYRQAV